MIDIGKDLQTAYNDGYSDGFVDGYRMGSAKPESEWIAQDETYTRFRCSACGSENHRHRWEYCCRCGAKMESE